MSFLIDAPLTKGKFEKSIWSNAMSTQFPVTISFTTLANFLGIVGVIGSLTFVGLELRLTRKLAEVETEW